MRASATSKLQILEANGVGISPQGAKLLGEALPASPLLSLKLQDNSIGDEGAESLGKACAAGAPVQDLSLGNNQVYLLARNPLPCPNGRSRLALQCPEM